MSNRNEHGLTPQQDRFAREIGAGRSGLEAYRAAYPKSKDWKDQSVRVNASKLLADTNISQRISKIQAEAAATAGLESAKVLEELRRIVHSDIAGIIGDNGKVLLPNEMPPAARAAIASVKVDEFGRIEYKFWDKNSAIEKAMKHLGLFEKDNDQNRPPPAPAIIQLVPLQPAPKADDKRKR